MEIILRKIFPYFISIDEINKQKSQFKTHYEEKDNTGLCYEIPLSFTTQSFDYIRDFQKSLVFKKLEKSTQMHINLGHKKMMIN